MTPTQRLLDALKEIEAHSPIYHSPMTVLRNDIAAKRKIARDAIQAFTAESSSEFDEDAADFVETVREYRRLQNKWHKESLTDAENNRLLRLSDVIDIFLYKTPAKEPESSSADCVRVEDGVFLTNDEFEKVFSAMNDGWIHAKPDDYYDPRKTIDPAFEILRQKKAALRDSKGAK